ncbi:wall-associated receptor kinase-like 10 [Senna tora]|uniref:Wall-associated receptor kinase-like 10 n=1 Tax=Senna tora TaxID=362788 RepID=A0A835CJJ5_9FABA|nr:wall-associated receptor kinase-like 10 [Senna tora]
MVSTRMEGRVENLEKEMGGLKEDMTQMKEVMLLMKDTLERLEKKVDKGDECEQSEGSGDHGNGDKEKGSEEELNKKAKRCTERSFELLSAPLEDAPEAMLIGAYQNGLKEEIRAELRMVKAQTLMEVMDLAQQIKERNKVLAKIKEEQDQASKAFKVFQSTSTNWTPSRPNAPKLPSPTNPSPKTQLSGIVSRSTKSKTSEGSRVASNAASSSKGRHRRLADEELARKRCLGECFTCDEKWGPTHKCKNKHLQIMIISGPMEEGDAENLGIEEEEHNEEGEATGNLMSLSMNSIVGITNGRTMKLIGKVRGKEVLIMIDCGASHNFISTSLVEKLALTKLGEVDLILGMAWLESLGDVSVNWKQLTMKYKAGDETVCLKGDSSLARIEVSYKAVMRSIKKGGQGYMIELGMVEAQVEGESKVPEEIQSILTEFSEVCEPLKGLPPHRRRDHTILINEDQQKWASKLMGYSFEIQYKPGVENKAADSLSRREEKIELNAFSVWKFDELDSWEEEVRKDKRLSEIKEQIITGSKPPVGYDMRNGCLVYNGCLVVPKESTSQYIIAEPGCESSCGSLQIPYPFGMNDPKCYYDKWFEIECRNSSYGGYIPFLKLINMQVTYISESSGSVMVRNPVYRWNCKDKSKDVRPYVDMRGSPFMYSQENRFMAVGCNSVALLLSDGLEVGGCVSVCDTNIGSDDILPADGCHGRYCCETSLPGYLSEYNATFEDIRRNVSSIVECNYAVIAYQMWEPVNTSAIGTSVPAFLSWEIVNYTNQLPFTQCDDTNITSSGKNVSGQRCHCSYGYSGNPYIAGGCVAMPKPSKKKSIVKWVIVGVFSSLGSIVFLVGVWFLYKILRKRRTQKRKEKYFKQNGGLLLQQRQSSGNVNFDKTKLFSIEDLEKATDRFNVNRILGKGGQGTVYKGMLADGHIVAIKKFKVEGNVEEFINEVSILSQINHRNVVKLLGFCLETQLPLLVYEFIPNGNLYEYLHDQNEELPMTWEMRLRIAIEVAGALFYLHSVASQPIYHRDIKPTNILLDEKYRAKVADFGTSRMVSIENTHLTTLVQGTFGYLDPEYFHTSQFTEKSDVYSFGVVLVELLTGEKPISSGRPEEAKSLASYFTMCMEEGRVFDVVDRRIMVEGGKEDILQVAKLAERCLELNGRKRPTMKEVTMELEGIQKLGKKSLMHNI